MARIRYKTEDQGCKIQVAGLCFLVLCSFLFVGCSGKWQLKPGWYKSWYKTSKSAPDEVREMPTDEKKAKLFKRIERKYGDPEAHYELGQTYQVEGMWSKAADCYNTALNFDPAHRRAQAAMVKVTIDSGDTAKAEQLADIFMGQASIDATESLKLALAFQRQYLDEYAVRCYQQALRLAPNSAKINRQMGYYYMSKGNKERAKDYLSRSFALDSNQPDVAGELGRLGIQTMIPRETERNMGKLDRIVEKSDEERYN